MNVMGSVDLGMLTELVYVGLMGFCRVEHEQIEYSSLVGLYADDCPRVPLMLKNQGRFLGLYNWRCSRECRLYITSRLWREKVVCHPTRKDFWVSPRLREIYKSRPIHFFVFTSLFFSCVAPTRSYPSDQAISMSLCSCRMLGPPS